MSTYEKLGGLKYEGIEFSISGGTEMKPLDQIKKANEQTSPLMRCMEERDRYRKALEEVAGNLDYTTDIREGEFESWQRLGRNEMAKIAEQALEQEK